MATNIWFVDDDEDDFDFFNYAVRQIIPEAKITHFPDVDLKTFQRSSLPDIVFLDLALPSMNGLECLKKLREEKKFDPVPIIIYAARLQQVQVDDACNSGANYYIVKPESFIQMKEILKFIFSIIRTLWQICVYQSSIA